jgi:hypothetical protein
MGHPHGRRIGQRAPEIAIGKTIERVARTGHGLPIGGGECVGAERRDSVTPELSELAALV